jgi:hypothetical protein
VTAENLQAKNAKRMSSDDFARLSHAARHIVTL